jgi:hypothetical protein
MVYMYVTNFMGHAYLHFMGYAYWYLQLQQITLFTCYNFCFVMQILFSNIFKHYTQYTFKHSNYIKSSFKYLYCFVLHISPYFIWNAHDKFLHVSLTEDDPLIRLLFSLQKGWPYKRRLQYYILWIMTCNCWWTKPCAISRPFVKINALLKLKNNTQL